MSDENKAKARATAKEKRAAKAKAKTESKASSGLRLGATPDHATMHKIRCRTQTGFRLYLPAIEMYAPGETTELEVTSGQLERLTADGRVMIGKQIDAYELEVAGIKDRKPHGTRVAAPRRTEVPVGLPVNYPGGERNPTVKVPKDAKSAKELVEAERKALEGSRAS
jgi:hypothetical protein